MPEDIFENDVEVAADIPQSAEVRQYTSSIEIGDVTTLPAGSQATVTNTGTEERAILNFGLPKGDAGSMWGELAGDIEDQADLNTLLTGLRTDVNAKAPLASPALTGTPTAPTAADDTNTTQIATTAFVKNAITNLNNALQTYVQNYVNTAVANVLKTMDWANAVQIYVSPSAGYTCPSDGYIICYNSNNSAVIQFSFSGKLAPIHTGVPISVTSGTIIKGTSSYQTSVATFIPCKS